MDIKLIISADESALEFARLIGKFTSSINITNTEKAHSEPKNTKIEQVEEVKVEKLKVKEEVKPTKQLNLTDEVEIPNYKVGKTEVAKTDVIYSAVDLRKVALSVPKEKQTKIMDILIKYCDEGVKPSITNVKPEVSNLVMQELQALGGMS